MVVGGDVRNEDRIGNDGADSAADLCRSRQKDEAITARRALICVGSHWYLVMLDLHKFMVAISRVEVIHDGHALSKLLSIMLHCQVHLDFWTAPGAACPILLFLRRMLLSGPTV